MFLRLISCRFSSVSPTPLEDKLPFILIKLGQAIARELAERTDLFTSEGDSERQLLEIPRVELESGIEGLGIEEPISSVWS